MVRGRAGYDTLDCLPALVYNKNQPKRIAVSSGPINVQLRYHDMSPIIFPTIFPHSMPLCPSGNGGRFHFSLAGAGVFGGVGG
jgi:hypothetical protein